MGLKCRSQDLFQPERITRCSWFLFRKLDEIPNSNCQGRVCLPITTNEACHDITCSLVWSGLWNFPMTWVGGSCIFLCYVTPLRHVALIHIYLILFKLYLSKRQRSSRMHSSWRTQLTNPQGPRLLMNSQLCLRIPNSGYHCPIWYFKLF